MSSKESRAVFGLAIIITAASLVSGQDRGAEQSGLFRHDNLLAWCIVPFDSFKRPPIERAKMLRELGIKKFAYDYRAEHIPTFEEEILALKDQGIELTAWWFPGQLNDEAKMTLDIFSKHQVSPQLWVSGGGERNMTAEQEAKFIEAEVARLRPIADAGAKIGCKLGLYNHGGWFGAPENLVKMVKAIDRPNVGVIYNLHHAHDELDRIPQVLEVLIPHLLVLNVNGMETDGDRIGKKILVIGEGNRDKVVYKAIRDSGYTGPIGIINHTQEDAQERLTANLRGLEKLLKSLD